MDKTCLNCNCRSIGCHGFCKSYKDHVTKMKSKKDVEYLREQEYKQYLFGVDGAYNRMKTKRSKVRVY